MTRLSLHRLLAMREALAFRLAGPIDETDAPPLRSYEEALQWVNDRIARIRFRQTGRHQ